MQSNSSGSSDGIFTPCNGFSVKPWTYVFSCADMNSEITNLHWFAWGDATAYATGEARWNDCQPTCVAGHWRSQAATIWAWDLRAQGPIAAYTQLQITGGILAPGSSN